MKAVRFLGNGKCDVAQIAEPVRKIVRKIVRKSVRKIKSI